MDELDLARKAVRRRFLTEEQLREALSFAEGGRSLLAVLLDLGYLRPAQLLELGDAPPPPPPPPRRPRIAPWVFLSAAILLIAGAAARGRLRVSPPPAPPPSAAPSSVPAGPSFRALLARRAGEILRRTEAGLSPEGRPPESALPALRRAAALLEEALDHDARDADLLLALARTRELLDQWEDAAELYRAALRRRPDDPAALTGAARVALLMLDYREGFRHADRACRLSTSAEPLLLRGQARAGLGDREGARRDFLAAAEREPRCRDRAARLLRKLDAPP
ncbi:MAG TPA: tetratricopeptide repeat protein [Planctomycetota bacterium]|nr:tetratricopeptide repeat protein [Planctomycetota bacterium]